LVNSHLLNILFEELSFNKLDERIRVSCTLSVKVKMLVTDLVSWEASRLKQVLKLLQQSLFFTLCRDQIEHEYLAFIVILSDGLKVLAEDRHGEVV
jgi:hypothetical protein